MLNYSKKAVFFDLDHTLWDFDRNAGEALSELYDIYGFNRYFGSTPVEHFISTYSTINQQLWGLYNTGKITKEVLRKRRFRETFQVLGADPDAFPEKFEEDYLAICPRKPHLFPHAIEVLEYLRPSYSLHLISNGFREACQMKIRHSGLEKYFQNIVISELVGVLKPHPAIFHHALAKAVVSETEAVMIGDNLEADVNGAMKVGIEAIFFNPNGLEIEPEGYLSIRSLDQLRDLL